jgi:hypothetical protein
MPSETAGTPARGYSWPPFEPGNEVALRHGAYSPRRVDPLAKEIVDHLLTDPELAYLHAPRHRWTVLALGRAEAQVQLLVEYLADLASALHEDDPGHGGIGGRAAAAAKSFRRWVPSATSCAQSFAPKGLAAAR